MGASIYDDGKALTRCLGPERTADVANRLTMSESPKSVAKLIQSWDCMEGRSLATILTMVSRYRQNVTSQDLTKRVQRALGTHRHVKALDTMAEMEGLIKIQRDRIEKALKLEEKTDFLMAQTNAELRLLKDLCKDLATIQLETGVLQRAAKQVTGVFGGSDGKTISFHWTDTDENLLEGLTADPLMIESTAIEVTSG